MKILNFYDLVEKIEINWNYLNKCKKSSTKNIIAEVHCVSLIQKGELFSISNKNKNWYRYELFNELKNAPIEKYYSQNSLSVLLIKENINLLWFSGKVQIKNSNNCSRNLKLILKYFQISHLWMTLLFSTIQRGWGEKFAR